MKAAPKNDDPIRFLPIGVRKSYFLLPKADRDVLNIATKAGVLEVYSTGEISLFSV
jgi:hypothetical protein